MKNIIKCSKKNIYKTYYESPVGKILIASKDKKIIGLWIEGQKNYLENLDCEIKENDKEEVLINARDWLDRYFNLENPDISELSLAPIGGEFRQKVWKMLCEIPYGETVTYGEIAKKIAKENNIEKMSAQAIGGAVGHNPISIIIPCHRVIGANGNLTGYAGGIEIKIKLLELEGVNIEKLYRPK